MTRPGVPITPNNTGFQANFLLWLQASLGENNTDELRMQSDRMRMLTVHTVFF